MTGLHDAVSITVPWTEWQEIISHCRRKLAGDFLPGETRVRRAYGMLAGTVEGDTAVVRMVIPFKKNARGKEPLKSYMDNIMARYAVPSTTPMDQRGWITDPEELRECYESCDSGNMTVFGTYHMHIVPWDHDPVRDTPTRLDMVLAENSGLFSFIISLVDPDNPVMRAFMEGNIKREVRVELEAGN